jgi:hypothetical protein
MHLVTKKEIELQVITANNILAGSNFYLDKSTIVEFLEKIKHINNLRFTKVKFLESRQEKERKDNRKGFCETYLDSQ